MATISVTSQAQAVYPDGQQDSFVIKNNGPYTIYVDSDSSISVNSHAIPPTGTMAWDAGRALWVIGSAGGTSTATITRNSTPAVFTNDSDVTILTRQDALYSVGGQQQKFQTPIMECTAFQSLVFTFSCPTYLSPLVLSSSFAYSGTVEWLDLNGKTLSIDSFTCPAQTDTAYAPAINQFPTNARPGPTPTPNAGSRVTMVVKGSAFRLTVQALSGANIATPDIVTTRILGTTRALKPRMSWTPYDTDPTSHLGIASFDYVTADSFGMSSYALAGNPWPHLYIPNISNKLRFRFITLTAGTANGLVYFTDAFTGTIQMSVSTVINSAAFTYLDITVDLPIYSPVRFTVNTPVNNAGAGVAASCNGQWL